MKSKTRLYLLLTLIFFGLIYALISIVNHYFFRTYALDLGLYTNALYKYAHLTMADSTMIKEFHELMLGGHFDLYLVLFSPFIFIFGSYTLLIIQISGVLLGGLGIYRFFELSDNKSKFTPLLATIFFFLFYGVFSAISYDYHSTVIAAMIVPWLLFYFKKENYGISLLFMVLILISQENVALWLVFICLGLLYEYRKNKVALAYLSVFILVSLIYFFTVIYVVIPGFSNSGEYTGFTYSILGRAPVEAFINLFLHPVDNFRILFTNHNNSLYGDYVKIEMHLIVLISGAYLLLLKPQYLIMLIPVYIQKLFNDNYLVWGIDGQYSIEFAPVLAIGVFSAINEFRDGKARKILTAIVLLGVVLSTIRVMDNTVMYTNKSRLRFYQAAHYQRKYDVKQVHEQLNMLPSNAKISAQSPFVPHLALRDHIYQFPVIKDAEFIVYSEKEGKYPMSEEGFVLEINMLKESGEWVNEFSSEDIVILKRRIYRPTTND